MSDLNEHTGPGAPQAPIDDDIPDFNPRGKRIYAPIKEGAFVFPWGEGEVKLQHLAGRYLSHEIVWDWGKPESKIKQNWRLVVELKTKDFGTLHVQSSTNGMIAMLYLLAAISSFNPEQPIGLQLSQGDQGENPVTFVWPYRYDRAAGDWVQITKEERRKWTGQTTGEYDVALKEALDFMRVHPGWQAASKGVNYETSMAVQSHPTKGMVPPAAALAGQSSAPSQQPAAPPPTPNVPQERPAPSTNGGSVPARPQEGLPEFRADNPYGYTPPRYPGSESWTKPASEQKTALLLQRLAELVDPEGKPLDAGEKIAFQSEVLTKLYGSQGGAFRTTSAGALVLYDFVANATGPMLTKAIEGALAYDPFADD